MELLIIIIIVVFLIGAYYVMKLMFKATVATCKVIGEVATAKPDLLPAKDEIKLIKDIVEPIEPEQIDLEDIDLTGIDLDEIDWNDDEDEDTRSNPYKSANTTELDQWAAKTDDSKNHYNANRISFVEIAYITCYDQADAYGFYLDNTEDEDEPEPFEQFMTNDWDQFASHFVYKITLTNTNGATIKKGGCVESTTGIAHYDIMDQRFSEFHAWKQIKENGGKVYCNCVGEMPNDNFIEIQRAHKKIKANNQ